MLRSVVLTAMLAVLAGNRATVSGRWPSAGTPLRYVALGDSYTIGTSVTAAERWPDQLVARLAGMPTAATGDGAGRPTTLELVANLAVNGFTSRDVIERELRELDALRPEFASLLVGVNDVVRGVTAQSYEANAARILDHLLARVAANRLVAVSTPDYTVTPQGASYGVPAVQAAGIRANNEILMRLARARGIAWVDVHDVSLRAAEDRSLVASDGLHPSGHQYALWVDRILPVVERLLREER